MNIYFGRWLGHNRLGRFDYIKSSRHAPRAVKQVLTRFLKRQRKIKHGALPQLAFQPYPPIVAQ